MKTESVAIVLYPGCILFELALTLEFLEKKFRVEAFSPEGGAHLSSFGVPIETKPLREGPPPNCRAVLLPGGDFTSIVDLAELTSFLTRAAKAQAVFAAICGGTFALGQAGLLRGRKFVHPFGPRELAVIGHHFADSYPQGQDKEFLHDGPLLTAQPFAHIDFAVELAARLGAILPEKIIFYKNYHRGFPRGRIRPLALALVRRPNGQLLLHEGVDRVKKEIFYRPLGGGIEFGENARLTLAREFEEEIGEEIEVGRELGAVENLFSYEGMEGHEVHLLFEARFVNPAAYERDEFRIDESGQDSGRAVWMSPAEIAAANRPLYPRDLSSFLSRH